MATWKGIIGKGFKAADFDDYLATVKFNAWRPQFVVLHNTQVPKLKDWHKVPGQQQIKNLEKFYKKLQSRDLRVREFEKVLEQRVFEEVGPRLSQSGTAAKQYYSALPVSDQSLIREFYLERIEKVDPRLRQRFQRIYRYY